MASEASVQISLQIVKGNLNYRSSPQTFTATVASAKGPTPGVTAISTLGTDVTFTQLTQPAFCWMQNLDAVNYVEWGIKEPDLGRFYAVGKIDPGECYLIKLSPNLGEEYLGTGTGTPGAGNAAFHFRAHNAACNVRIEAFEE